MSTKTTLFTILAVVGAALGSLGTTLGLSINLQGVVAGVASILVYVFGALKTDLAGLNQPLIWKDPKTYLAMANAIIAALGAAGVTLPVDPSIIIAVLTAIMGWLFKPTQVIAAIRRKKFQAAIR